MQAGFYKLASSLDFASFSTIFKHWSENSTNSGSCMADFIASSLRSAPSIEHNNCLRWGLQSRSFSSFDWPGDKENSSYSHTLLCVNVPLLLHEAFNFKCKKWRRVAGAIPNIWSLCRGTLSVMSSSCRRSSTLQGSAKTSKKGNSF